VTFQKKKSLGLEFIVWSVSLLALGYILRGLLFFKETTFIHDTFYWNYPVFHFFATQLMQGTLPLWDPYTAAGQPFYPLLIQLRLLEPIAILTVLIGKIFTRDTTTLFHWTRILESLWMVAGSALVLRRFSRTVSSKILLVPLLLFSSFFLGTFHQDGILNQFLWAPWIFFLLLRIVFDGKRSSTNWALLGLCIGINFQSYFFVGVSLLIFFFLVGTFLFHRAEFLSVIRSPDFLPKASLCAVTLLTMLAPNLILMKESDRLLYPVRMFPIDFKDRLLKEKGLLPAEPEPDFVEQGIRLPYEAIPYSGAFVKPWEWVQSMVPNANPNIHSLKSSHIFGSPSEAYFYIGILGWIMAWVGVFFGRHPLKKLWLFYTVGFGLLMMGPPMGLHRLLYPIFPPLWFLRHTTLLVLFFVLGALGLFVMGVDRLADLKEPLFHWNKSLARRCIATLTYASFLCFAWIFATKLEYPIFKFPETNFLFVLVLLAVLAGWIMKGILGKGGLLVSILLSQLAAIFFLHPNPRFYALYFAPVFFILLVGLFSYKALPRKILLPALGALLIFDLGFSFSQGERLYGWLSHPSALFQKPMEPNPVALMSREPYPITPNLFAGNQAPRYLSLFYQRPFALHGLILFRGETSKDRPLTLAHGLEAPRWNSLIQTRKYFDLVHSKFPPDVLMKIFAVGESPIQFKSVGVSEKPSPAGLKASFFDNLVLLAPEEKDIFLGNSETKKFFARNYTGNELVLQVELSASQLLYWADGFDRWWSVQVDGKDARILVANRNFKAVAVPAGKHEVKFLYNPRPFLFSLLLFYGVPFLILAGCAIFGSITLRRVEREAFA
jgi:hypothetical protein